MKEKKRKYEKPVIQDLGRMLSGSAQMPMGSCIDGGSPSGSVIECESGGSVISTGNCRGGGLPATCSVGESF